MNIKRVLLTTIHIFNNPGNHKREVTLGYNILFVMKKITMKTGVEFAGSINGLNHPTKCIFFNNQVMFHCNFFTVLVNNTKPHVRKEYCQNLAKIQLKHL